MGAGGGKPEAGGGGRQGDRGAEGKGAGGHGRAGGAIGSHKQAYKLERPMTAAAAAKPAPTAAESGETQPKRAKVTSKGTQPHPSMTHKLRQDVRSRFTNLDFSPKAIQQHARHHVATLASKGVKVVSLVADDMMALQAMRLDKRFQRAVGASGKHANMTYEELLDRDTTLTHHSLARRVKFWAIHPQSNDPLQVIAIRPGGADGDSIKNMYTLINMAPENNTLVTKMMSSTCQYIVYI